MRKIEIDAIVALAAVLGLAAIFIDWFSLKANRLVSGEGLGYFQSLGNPLGAAIAVLWVLVFFFSLFRNRWSRTGLAVLFLVALAAILIGSGFAARRLLPAGESLARVSLSGGFWISALAVYLLYFAATRKGQPFSLAVSLAGSLIIIAAIAFGWLDKLSVIVEFKNQQARFIAELWRHLDIFGVSLLAAMLIGLPLGILASRTKLANPVIYVLSIFQTIPSLALFGFLLVILSALRNALPSLGISAIGFLPAVIAITLYALLPIVQNTYTGLKSVAPDILDAGAGVGMGHSQEFFNVQLPLASPAILSGIRIAAVQAVGGTALAALIGAGGLGFFIFQGLGQAASDLILLGAVSVVVLALVVNGIFQLIENRLRLHQVAQT